MRLSRLTWVDRCASDELHFGYQWLHERFHCSVTFKVTNFCAKWKPMLFPINDCVWPILNRFRNIASGIRKSPHPRLSPNRWNPFEFRSQTLGPNSLEIELVFNANNAIVASSVLSQYTRVSTVITRLTAEEGCRATVGYTCITRLATNKNIISKKSLFIHGGL